MKTTAKRGFTLIELLVVIAIIGILSAVILASLSVTKTKGFDAKRVTDLREVQKALELYASNNGGSYPSTGGSYYSQCTISGVTTQSANNVIPGIISDGDIGAIPSDPQMVAAAGTCCYMYKSDGTNYKFIDYICPTATYGNPNLRSLVDPARPGPNLPSFAWAVYTQGAAAW